MEYGAHLPLIEFDSGDHRLAHLRAYTRSAAQLGFRLLSANDHLLFARPWLDGPTALAATVGDSGDMTLASTIALPVIRGPIQTAKTIAALDVISDGRMVAGVGPGSSPRDYEAVGIDWDERWPRYEESIRTLRALLRSGSDPFVGTYYSTQDIDLAPPPVTPAGPPIWIASWGSAAGLRRAARLGDGWLASAYNTTPARFRESLELLPGGFPNAVSTAWMFVTEDRREADRVLADVLAPMLGRTVEALKELSLPIGSAEECAERLSAWRDAGAQRLFVWPLGNDLEQLERFAESVVPLVGA